MFIKLRAPERTVSAGRAASQTDHPVAARRQTLQHPESGRAVRASFKEKRKRRWWAAAAAGAAVSGQTPDRDQQRPCETKRAVRFFRDIALTRIARGTTQTCRCASRTRKRHRAHGSGAGSASVSVCVSAASKGTRGWHGRRRSLQSVQVQRTGQSVLQLLWRVRKTKTETETRLRNKVLSER